eukprot:342075_1
MLKNAVNGEKHAYQRVILTDSNDLCIFPTNLRSNHTLLSNNIYTKPYSSSEISNNCFEHCNKFVHHLIGFLFISGVAVSIVFGGYKIVQIGMRGHKYGESFSIEGKCIVTRRFEDTNNCGEYGCQTLYNYQIFNGTICSDKNNYIFTNNDFDDVINGGYHNTDDIVSCWTNKHCDDVFLSKNSNENQSTSNLIYFGSAFVFAFSCVFIVAAVGYFQDYMGIPLKNICTLPCLYITGKK